MRKQIGKIENVLEFGNLEDVQNFKIQKMFNISNTYPKMSKIVENVNSDNKCREY